MEKLYSPEPPKRFCSRCGAEIVWSEPEGWEYNEQTGKVLTIRIRGICPTHEQKDGRAHFHEYLFWPTGIVKNEHGVVRLNPDHWYTSSSSDYYGLKEYCGIPKVESFVKTSQSAGIGTGGTDDENGHSETR